jgi:predicted O-methyltransferase YrrM
VTVDNRRGDDLAAVLARIDGVEGWLTEAQAAALFHAARSLHPGQRIVEIGSFRGRSTTVLGLAAAPGVDIIAIDPHAGNDRGPNELDGYAEAAAADHEVFLANLAAAGLGERVRHVRSFSQAALTEVDGPVDVVFIDGAHRYQPALADIRAWGHRLPSGGTLLIHDAFSSVGVTAAIATELLASRRYRYLGRVGSLARYRVEPQRGRARLVNAVRQLAELPWFARNVAIKALIVARLAWVTPLLGHRDASWPF